MLKHAAITVSKINNETFIKWKETLVKNENVLLQNLFDRYHFHMVSVVKAVR